MDLYVRQKATNRSTLLGRFKGFRSSQFKETLAKATGTRSTGCNITGDTILAVRTQGECFSGREIFQGHSIPQHNADADIAVKLHGFLEIVFADDLNCYKDFGLSITNSKLHAQMRQCQGEIPKWSRANQVSFDLSKASMHVLALRGAEG